MFNAYDRAKEGAEEKEREMESEREWQTHTQREKERAKKPRRRIPFTVSIFGSKP